MTEVYTPEEARERARTTQNVADTLVGVSTIPDHPLRREAVTLEAFADLTERYAKAVAAGNALKAALLGPFPGEAKVIYDLAQREGETNGVIAKWDAVVAEGES